MKRKLNLKVLLIVGVVLCVIGGGGYALYVARVQRIATTLLDQARRAEEAGRFEDAAGLLGNYLAYRPKDNEQRLRMGTMLEQAATAQSKAQAISVYARVLRAEPQRLDLRRRLVELAIEQRRFDAARPHLPILLAAAPNDAKWEYLQGVCAEAAREDNTAAEWYEKARQHGPTQIEPAVRLAGLLRRRLDQAEQADRVMDELIAANGSSVQAVLARAAYRKRFGSFEGWAEDVARARQLAPDELDVLLAAAELAQARNDLDQARTLLNRAVERAPDRPGLYVALAGVETEAGRHDEAVACLRRGLKQSDHDDLQEALGEALLEAGKVAEAREQLSRLRERKAAASALTFLEARLLMVDGNWAEAAKLLGALAPKLDAGTPRAAQVERTLAVCHERLANPDRAVESFRKALRHDERGSASRLALATALLNAGRTEEAIGEARRVVAQPQAPAAGLLLLARALVARNLRLSPAERDWKEVDEVLARAQKVEVHNIELNLLRAEALAGRGQLDAARTFLEEARDRQPQQAALWIALIALSERQGKVEQTRALLSQAREKLGDRAELRLAWLRHWAAQTGDAAATALAECERDLGKYPEGQQPRLLAALAEARQFRGETREAERLWHKVAERRPNDLRPHIELLEFALKAGREADLQQQIDALRKIEGEEGVFWRFGEVSLQVLRGQRGDRAGLVQAEETLKELAVRRPAWARTAVLAASLDELRGDTYAAVENYRRAVERGDTQLGVQRRLLHLLTRQQRYDEAARVLTSLRLDQRNDESLLRLTAELLLQRQDNVKALELARRVVSDKSASAEDHLWLGQLLAASGQPVEAEKSLRHAVELATKDGTAWVVLVEFLARTGTKEKAEAAVKEARAQLTGASERAALARCHEVVGQLAQAEELHRELLAARPQDAGVLRGAAAFYLRTGQPNKAEPHLRKLLTQTNPATETAWARRALAGLLAQSGDARQFREALQLLEASPDKLAVEDKLALARILATRPGRRGQAARLLQELGRQLTLPADDTFFLAQLFEQDGDAVAARQTLEALQESQRGNALFHAYYARLAIRHGDLDKARLQVAALEKAEPKALRTAEVKARLLWASDQKKEAVALLLDQARSSKPSLLPVAALLEELGDQGAAETLYRQHAAALDTPEAVLVLAAYLGRRGQFEEALTLLDRAWKTCRPDSVALVGMAMLRGRGITAEQQARVEAGLTAALAKQSDHPLLLLHLANLRDRQGRYADAEAAYRAVLRREPRNVIALNNLAWLLAHHKESQQEALDLVGRAIDVVGPLPILLDTRALVYLNRGESERALADLTKAVEDEPSAVRSFHLARAQLLARERLAARTTLKTATKGGLTNDTLHPLERDSYQTLLKELEDS